MTKMWTNFAKFGFEINNRLRRILFNSISRCVFFYSDFRTPRPNSSERLNSSTLPLAYGRFNYIDITNDGLVIKSNPNEANYKFWSDILEEYAPYWTPKVFTYNSMAVKVPLAILCSLLVMIGFCKLIGCCSRRHKRRKSMAP